ncbi:hypothetical protein [endosymbiont GvMRE of Glomus versiforme]|uniref:hypothetical protein n=1 Tax=endosymbiont GvMRE of Glomus versiforme TaxID=2039283 RepID=UPI0011C353F1|nr:hypothetical protein [endosymbiont GvMRE of Glomus versiforme]
MNSIQKENAYLHSENFLSYLQQVLEKTKYFLKEINKIYFTSLPSGQTGIRISLSFLATLQVVNPEIKFYHINALLLQSGIESCISLLSIDRGENKYHVSIYKNKKCLLEEKIIYQKELEEVVKHFPDFSILKNFQKVDFLKNFQKLKKYFVLLNNVEEIDY